MYKILLTSLCFSFLFLTSVNAQKYKGQRFKVGAIAGLNIAQIDGDNMFGYRKLGAQVGIQGIAMLTKRQYLSMEFLFSQRGAVTSADDIRLRRMAYTDIRLNYVEIPFLIHSKVGDDKLPWGMEFYTGVAVSRLLGGRIEGVNNPLIVNPVLFLKDRTDEFSTFEIDYVFGGTFFINKNVGVTFRHTFGLNPLFKPLPNDTELQEMTSFYFMAGGVYILE